jgi:hypothetical protein
MVSNTASLIFFLTLAYPMPMCYGTGIRWYSLYSFFLLLLLTFFVMFDCSSYFKILKLLYILLLFVLLLNKIQKQLMILHI